MRVGVDVSILSSQLTGIGRFALSLVRSLARCYPDTEWALLGAPRGFRGLPEGENITVHSADGLIGWRRAIWQQVILPGLVVRSRLDVLHCPDFSRPIKAGLPVVNTIHDLSYYSPREFFSLGNRTYKRVLTRFAINSSSWIVADSEFTGREIGRIFGQKVERRSVAYLGMDPMPKILVPRDERPFVLHVGTLEERKNLLTLIRGFALACTQNAIPHRLILAGKPGRGFSKIQAAIGTCKQRGSIETPGYVSREGVLELYRRADLVVMPSIYEGFGLPVLEAMALGAPVVCSRAASLPEVGGDAVEYFDPSSPQELAAVLARVLGSQSLRSEMKRKGLERAKQFSWDDCARRYWDVYRRVAQE